MRYSRLLTQQRKADMTYAGVALRRHHGYAYLKSTMLTLSELMKAAMT
jgi:hypothetical protein